MRLSNRKDSLIIMNNILALDASTKRTGYAYFDKNNNLQYGVISSAATAPERRIGIMRDKIIEIIKENDINEVILEEVRPDGYNAHTGKLLTWLQGSIVIAIFEYNKNIKINFIGASSWRSIIGIQGYRIKRNQQKEKDITFVNQKYNLNLTSSQDDEADAIGILTAYTTKNNKIKVKQKLNPIGSEESAF